jgi:hypothetical protein
MTTIDSRTNPTFDPLAPEVHEWGRAETGLGPGLLGGALMALILVFLSFAQGRPFWHPFAIVASTLLGPDAMRGGAGSIVLGVFLHFLMAALLGMLFTTIFGRTTMRRTLGFGLFYSLFIWLVVQFVLMPLLNPFAATQLGTVWPFFLGHLAYGLILAASVPTVKDIDAPERGYIDPLRREIRP